MSESTPTGERQKRVVLISPKGPLYRHKGGIFGKGLRYMPQTFPTLVALTPQELNLSITCLDEGIQTINPETLEANLVGMTVITGSAPRAYELAATFRKRNIPVVLGGPHITLAPDDAAPHADALVLGWAERTWPQLLRDWLADNLQPRYTEQPDHILHTPRPDRTALPAKRYLTDAVFEATRGCVYKCEFCVSPAAWGQKAWQKPVQDVVDIRAHGKKRIIFIDLMRDETRTTQTPAMPKASKTVAPGKRSATRGTTSQALLPGWGARNWRPLKPSMAALAKALGWDLAGRLISGILPGCRRLKRPTGAVASLNHRLHSGMPSASWIQVCDLLPL